MLKKNLKKHIPPPPGPGRAKGSKNRLTKLREAVACGNREYFIEQSELRGRAIIDRFFKAAEAGQPWAIQEFFNRDIGKVKEFVEISAPDTTLIVKVVDVKE
jgi:hypothetical protein